MASGHEIFLHRRNEMMRRKTNWGKTPWKVTFGPKTERLPEAVDFAILGGGFTGLAAAAWLARIAPRKSVLLLEAGRLGEGTAGRNGGVELGQKAAGDLPGVGEVVAGDQRILGGVGVSAELGLSGGVESARG